MAKLNPQQNRHYPSKFKTGALHDDFRILYDHVYDLQEKLATTQGKLDDMTEKHGKLAEQVANGPSTTKIAGLNVKAVVPQNGQKLTYNSATGDIEWQ
jgi:hypothetical protein